MTTSTPMSVQMYLLGGAGINVGIRVEKDSRVALIKNSKKVGLDAGGNNPSSDKFPIKHMIDPSKIDDAPRGSGGVRALNSELVAPFIEQVLTEHKPADQNIIVVGTSGGTGSKLLITLVRSLIKLKKSVTLAIINDYTSTWETKNSVDVNTSLQNQTTQQYLGHNINFMDFYNTEDSNWGDVNKTVVDRLDHLGLIFSAVGGGGSLDHQDVHNTLNYSEYFGVPAAMSRISFHDQVHAEKLEKESGTKPPVMVISLFENSDSVTPRFKGAHKRFTGVFSSDQTRPNNMTELHMVLDHGEFVRDLEKKRTAFSDKQVDVKKNYVEQRVFGENANESGEVF